MNERLQEKLDQLSIELQERRRIYRNSRRYVFFSCVIILVFFSLYSALVSYKIREVATPSTIALLIAGQLREQFSADRNGERANVRRTAEDMAESILLAVPVSLHTGEEFLRDSLSQQARAASVRIADSLRDPLRRSIDRVLAPDHPDSPHPLVAPLLEEVARRQLTEKESSLMFPLPMNFGSRLREIRLKENSSLTRRDLCDRDFMLCWLYLHENNRYLDCSAMLPLMSFSTQLYLSWKDVMKGQSPSVQKKTNSSPMPKSTPARQ